MRLIDADKLKQHYAWWEDDRQKLFDEIVDQQPTIDTEPVVRCKDCKYWLTALSSDIAENGFCDLDVTYGRLRKREYFCSDAQRKDE